MRALGLLARVGVTVLVLVLLSETMAYDGWSESSQPPNHLVFCFRHVG